MAIERIDSIYDVQAIQAEQGAVIKALSESQMAINDLFNGITKFKSSNIVTAASDIAELQKKLDLAVKSSEDLQKANISLNQALAQANAQAAEAVKNATQNTATTQRATAAKKELTLEEAKAAEQLKKTNAETRLAAREAIAAENSYAKLDARLSLVTAAAKKLDLGSAEYKAAEGEIADLTTRLKELDANQNKFQRNVGNYAGSLAPAIGVLEKELVKIKAALDAANDSASSGAQLTIDDAIPEGFSALTPELEAQEAVIKKLEADYKTLTQLMNTLAQGAKNPQQELRQLTNAAKTLGTELGIESDAFREFVAEVGSKKDDLGDIQAIINFESSDTKYIDGVVSSISGIAAAYGAAESATVLFGGSTEELQESFGKLQAIMTLVTSLQEIQNFVQQDGAAIQTILAAKTALLGAAQKVNAALFATTAAAQTAQVASTVALSVATDAAVVGLAAEGVANEVVAATGAEAAVAMTGEAVATEAAAAATVTLGTALTATGIVAVIAALAAGIIYLTSKIPGWISGQKLSEEQLEDLTKAAGTLNTVLISQAKIVADNGNTFKNYYAKQIDFANAAGLNEGKLFARRKLLAEENKGLAQEQIDILGATNESYAKLSSAVEALQEKQRLATEEIVEFTKADDDRADAAKKLFDQYSSQLDAIAPLFDAQREARQNLFEANKQAGQLEIEQEKFNGDERRKLALALATEQAEIIIDKNDRILSNELSTQKQRLAAIRSSAAQERAIAQAENADVQNDPGSSQNDKIIAAKKLSNETIKIARDEAEKIFEINQDYANRTLAANKQSSDVRLNDLIALNNEIVGLEENSAEQRIVAAQKVNDAQVKLVEDDYTYQKALLAQKDAADGEYEALEVEKNSKLAALAVQGYKALLDIQNSEFKKSMALRERQLLEIQRRQQEGQVALAESYSTDVSVLGDSLNKKKISYQQYQLEISRLDKEGALTQMELQLRTIKDTLAAQEDLSGRLEDLQRKRADTAKQLDGTSDEKTKNDLKLQLKAYDDDLKALQDLLDKKLIAQEAYAKAVADLEKARVKTAIELRNEELEALATEITNLGSIVGNALGAISEIANIGFDKQKASIDELTAKQEKAYEDEVKRISQLNLSDADRADKLKVLEAQRTAQKTENDRKLRKIEIERARFEKASNIASIISSTAVAVVKALEVGGFLGIALAVSVGALGAAQLARAIATPLPSYKKGVNSKPTDGPAIVHAGEIVKEPGKQPWYTGNAAETFLPNLAKGAKVITADEVNGMMYNDMMRQTASNLVVVNQAQKPDRTLSELKDAVNRQTSVLAKAIAKQKPRAVVNVVASGQWGDYLAKKVYN